MGIVWTRHALERQEQWKIKLGITRREVEAVVDHPEHVVPGDGDIQIAQSRRGEGLIRVAFKSGADRKIITVYWTSKTEKYRGKP